VVILRPYGESAVLVEGDALDASGLAARLLAASVPGVIEVVAGARTVLVDTDGPASLARVEPIVRRTAEAGNERVSEPRTVRLPIRFDGPDVRDVAASCGLAVDELIEQLVGAPLRVAFCGFAPGFAYLDGLDPVLHLPRRATPRTRVEAGSFAIAAGYAAVYPGPSPGGWHLLGTTDAIVWDVTRDPPALLVPGTEVRVEVIGR